MPELLTPRLRLRAWRDADLTPLAALDADPEVMRWIGDGQPRTTEQTAASLVNIRAGWAERGWGVFAVEVRESGELAGWTGLAIPRFLPEIMPAVEIGWRLARAHWGRGYATEAAREALRFGFEDAGLDRVVSVCHTENHASARVMAKLGMREERRTAVPATGVPVVVRAITREEYAAAAGD
ncbi:GNAT family N-acetyltransferase [Streptomyces avicenniae]|uniref:GNAT family N-acetyltransferase n=1 Tax=Streptomyces avicenniae TaxID=500153 RepID=UPI00069AE751|nr:GNAT family N-acetyltransferase [Streptomyces avicenniae]